MARSIDGNQTARPNTEQGSFGVEQKLPRSDVLAPALSQQLTPAPDEHRVAPAPGAAASALDNAAE
jgi:hypothetical protein